MRDRMLAIVVALTVGALAVGALAVDPGLPSKTSVLTASLRAVGAKNPDSAFRNPDYLRRAGATEWTSLQPGLLNESPYDPLSKR